MQERNRIISIIIYSLSVPISLATNIASTVLPETLKPYLWYVWPLLGILIIISILLMWVQEQELVIQPEITLPEISPANKPTTFPVSAPKVVKVKVELQKPNRNALGIGLTIILIDFLYFLASQTPLVNNLLAILYHDPSIILFWGAALALYIGIVFGLQVFQIVVFLDGLFLIIQYQLAFNDWKSWWYMWTLFPLFLGIGQVVDSLFVDLGWLRKPQPRSRYLNLYNRPRNTSNKYGMGFDLILGSVILFLIVGVLLYNLFGFLGRISILLLIGLGFIWNAFTQRNRKKTN